MNMPNDIRNWVDDVAARWTDSALEMLEAAGVKGPSVAMELEAWRTLQDVLQAETRRVRDFRLPPLSVQVFMKQILLKTVLRVARKFEPGTAALALDNRLRPWIERQQVKASDYRLYLRIVRRPVTNSAWRPLSRSDFFPRMAAVGG